MNSSITSHYSVTEPGNLIDEANKIGAWLTWTSAHHIEEEGQDVKSPAKVPALRRVEQPKKIQSPLSNWIF